jgi:hypothetical protein
MKKLMFAAALLTALSGPAIAQDVSEAMQAWEGGQHPRNVTVMKDGKQCGYRQTAGSGHYRGHMVIGFASWGCGQAGGSFEIPISRVRISKQGALCVFQCTNGTVCLQIFPDGPVAASANMYEALPGSCDALAAAIARIAPQAESILSAEDNRTARQQQAIQAERNRRQQAADEVNARRQAALADCGSSPSISGGPWFSSTYKLAVEGAVTDTIHGMFPSFVCVKSVEYVGPAPNPFGGNAARAKFTGYDRNNFTLITKIREFPY